MDFVVKATLNGTIPTANIKVFKDRIQIWVKSTDNAVAVNAELKNISNEEFSLPIKNVTMLIKVLKLFDGERELLTFENKLAIFDKNRQVDIVLSDESEVDYSAFKNNKLKLKDGLKFEKKPNNYGMKLTVVSKDDRPK